ncbi:MAG: hypothetical protein LC808_20340 [Actinobacteria bacterium]|nr:hypothetical protein [Actinomycetota bacterium]
MTIDDDVNYTQYGPQAPHLKTLLHRCAALTTEETEALAAQWDKTRQGDPRPLLGWLKRKATQRRVTARERARHRADRAAKDADRDTQALLLRVDDITRYAARNSTVQTQFAAAKAATDAIRALVARDLIATTEVTGPEFQQGHYDLLTRPWRKVIGPVHPGDPADDRT